jgi:phage replication O-like protein O
MKELKPNFTQIPNIILDQYVKDCKPSHFVVLLMICRKIYGWHKEQDRISSSQIQEATGYDKNTIRDALRYWIGVGVLTCEETQQNRKGTLYRICINDVKNSPKQNDTKQNDTKQKIGGKFHQLEGEKFSHDRVKNSSFYGENFTPQNKIQNKEQNIYLNKEDEYKKNIANEISIKEYVVNNNVGSVKPHGITNQINEWFITLWKEYYKMPYKADLFETERLAHELNHDWESFLIIVKSYQSDPYWAKISMSPKMIRKAWDKLGSRAKVSEEQMREIRKMEIDTYEKKLLEHEQHKKELKQTADNWKPWNLKEDFEKMIGGKK